MAIGKSLDAAGRTKSAPFGPQNRYFIAFPAQLAADFGNPFSLKSRDKLDLVDEGCGDDQRADDENIEEAHDSPPLHDI